MPRSLPARLIEGYRKYFWILAAGVAGLDQWTKHILHSVERGREIMLLPGCLSIVSAPLNKRTAFSLGPSAPGFYIVIGVVGVCLIGYFFWTARPDRLWPHAVLGSICGGAVGNVTDRIALGGVRDFIDLHWHEAHWPTFNVADMGISIGVFLLVLEALVPVVRRRPGEPEKQPEASAR